MFISAQTHALLLLTADLGDQDDAGGDAPLDVSTFDRLSAWLRKRSLQPSDLLQPEAAAQLAGRAAGGLPAERILALLRRGPLLAAALERWRQADLWVISRGDPDYPRRLKRRLRTEAPPLLFGCGDRILLNRGGLALIGGDGAEPEALGFAARFAALAAGAGLTTISGGRSDIEAASLLGSLSRGGGAIAVLQDGLLQEASSERLRQRVGNGQLVLVSETAPDAAGRATGADHGPEQCLYGLSDAAVLIAVGRASGRWAGAMDAIEHDWIPFWVRTPDQEANPLLRLGARALPGDEVAPRTLLSPPPAIPPRPSPNPARPSPNPNRADRATMMPFATPPPAPTLVGFAEPPDIFGARPQELPDAGPCVEAAPPRPSETEPPGRSATHLRLVPSGPRQPAGREQSERVVGLFDIFVRRLPSLLADEPLNAWRIADALELTEQQAETWLRRAEANGQVRLDPVSRLYKAVSLP